MPNGMVLVMQDLIGVIKFRFVLLCMYNMVKRVYKGIVKRETSTV